MILNRKFGPYVLLKRLAVGGMAEIFLALKHGPRGFDKFVVIKCILAQFNDDEDYVRLFYRESAISGLLQHPNIIETYDCDVLDKTHYMVSEFMAGVTIAEMAERGAELGLPLPQDYAIQLCIDAAEALHYFHHLKDYRGQGLEAVHRDVSPQNVFVLYSGRAKLFDFGIASYLTNDEDEEPQEGMLAGKYAYMSPEQCRGERVDARSDIFSLGIILFELTTGTRLFKRDSQVQTLRAITEEDYPTPSERLERYPRFLERVVMRALAQDPKDRYQEGAELAEDLRKFLKISGSKPTAKLLSGYVKRLFRKEIKELISFQAAALNAVDQIHGKVENGIFTKTSGSTDNGADSAPLVEVPEKLEGRPTLTEIEALPPRHSVGPGRLARVELAKEEEEPEQALQRARWSSRFFAGVSVIAILVVAWTVFFASRHKDKRAQAPSLTEESPQAPSEGKLKLTSTPFGAQVYLDGELLREPTPLELAVPLDTDIEIKISAPGYEAYERVVKLGLEEQVLVIDAMLSEIRESQETLTKVRVDTSPSAAQLILDGRPLPGKTPQDLEVKQGVEHVLIADAQGFASAIWPFEAQGKDLALELELVPIQRDLCSMVIVDSWPRGASVKLQDLYVGKTPLPPLRLAANQEHRFAFTTPEGQVFETVVTPQPGEVVNLNPRFEEQLPGQALSKSQLARVKVVANPVTQLYLDNVLVGETPITLDLEPGTHWFEFVQKAQGIRHAEVMNFSAGGASDIEITIPRGQLSVHTSPPAEVFVDGQPQGISPIEIEVFVGEHEVKLVYDEQEKVVQAPIKRNKVYRINERFHLP